MVTRTGLRRNATVLDFGLGGFSVGAVPADSGRLTGSHELLGTPSYAATEQLRGRATVPPLGPLPVGPHPARVPDRGGLHVGTQPHEALMPSERMPVLDSISICNSVAAPANYAIAMANSFNFSASQALPPAAGPASPREEFPRLAGPVCFGRSRQSAPHDGVDVRLRLRAVPPMRSPNSCLFFSAGKSLPRSRWIASAAPCAASARCATRSPASHSMSGSARSRWTQLS